MSLHHADLPDPVTEPRHARRVEISVVVCAYTEQRWLEIVAAVASVAEQTRPALECLLVVDHNPDLAKRARTELPACSVLESGGDKGLSGARNSGIEAARGDVVAFLDDDAVAAPNWLERLAAAYRDDNVVAAGGLVTPAWVAGRPGWFPPEFDWVVGCSHSGMPASPQPVRNLVGANMSFRKDVLSELGGFSSALGRVGADTAGCEETELCIRAGAMRPGSTVLYDPAARVEHRVPPARGTWSYFVRRCLGEGRSKAAVSSLAGTASGLSSERSYVVTTLPRGVLAAAGAAARGQLSALGRVAAILLGLSVTAAGYAASSRRAPRPRGRGRVLAGLLLPAAAFALWVSVLVSPVALGRMNDLGLVSVLPARFWVAVGLVCVSFCAVVRRRAASAAVLGAHLVLLLAMLHATPAILYQTLRYTWAWKHVAIIDYVITHHGVDLSLGSPTMVAYQDWPGFFTLNAFVTKAAGLSSPISYASWAPFVNELLYGLPLMAIFRRFSEDPRVRWSALLIFYLGNWIGQDYFSPQGFAFFLYLCVIAVVLRFFLVPSGGGRLGLGPRRRWLRRSGEPAMARLERLRPVTGASLAVPALAGGMPAQPLGGNGASEGLLSRAARAASIGLVGSGRAVSSRRAPAGELAAARSARRREVVTGFAFCIVCMWAIASSHQLTPFMLVAALVLLALSRRLSHYSLAVLSLVIAGGWIAIGARTFVGENLSVFYAGLGHLLSNATVAKYNAGLASHDQILIADIDRAYTLFVGLLALVGAVRAVRSGRFGRLLPAALLAVAPALALASNNYGGEIVFRVYLFSLPFLALFAALVFERRSRARRGVLADLARPLVVLALLAGFAVSYYGKERSNYFPVSEVSTLESFYASIPPHSLVVSAAGNFPWPLHHYQTYEDYLFTTDRASVVRAVEQHPVTTLARDLGGPKPSYLVFATSDAALVNMTGAMPPGDYRRIERAVVSSRRFRVVVHTSQIEIVTLAGR